MDFIKTYKLIKNQDGYDIIIYVKKSSMDVEFANGLGAFDNFNSGLKQNILDNISQKFPHLKINTVKIMAGTVLLSSFIVTIPFSVSASEVTTIQAQIAYNYDINVSIDGKVQSFQNKALVFNNLTYVPIVEFGSAIGASVWANETSNTMGINKDATKIAFIRGATAARVNGVQTSMPPSMVIGTITYVPLNFIAENLGYKVTLKTPIKTVDISNAITKVNYTVLSGDTLWNISQKFGATVDAIKNANGLTGDSILLGQTLIIPQPAAPVSKITYTVISGDTLWKISQLFGIPIDVLKQANNLLADNLSIGQTLTIPQTVPVPPAPSTENIYTVLSGDTLWKISQMFGVTIDSIKSSNNLIGDSLSLGQKLVIPKSTTDTTPINNTSWPAVTYIVQDGDTATSIAKKFGVNAQDIMKYNYMTEHEWFNSGDKIAISGYAPRLYTVTSGQAYAPTKRGALVDWFLEGQYLVKRNDIFTIVDVDTGKQFTAKMLGGYNHIDIEPLTASDTAVMISLFGTWQWSPRAVVIFIDGMNLAASLSGMPHDVDTVDNGVTGHFDLYMKNSTSHSTTTSTAYIRQHQDMVLKAAGL